MLGPRVNLHVIKDDPVDAEALIEGIGDEGNDVHGVAVEQGEVFGRFHRARNVSAYPGNGLGLAVVKAVIERGGGTVSFTSSPAGTVFRMSLPLS